MMQRRVWGWLAAALALCGGAAARAGSGPNWLEFENVSAHPDYVFYLYPRDFPRGSSGNSSVQLHEGSAVSVKSLRPDAIQAAGGVYLYAVPAALVGGPYHPADDRWFTNPPQGVMKSEPLVNARRQVVLAVAGDSDSVRYHVAVGDTLKLTAVEREHTAAGGAAAEVLKHWYCYAFPLLVIGLAAWSFASRNRTTVRTASGG